MSKFVPADITEHFSSLPDHRIHIKKNERELIYIIVIAICAVICGADNWHEISQYGIAKQDWLKTFLHLPNYFHRMTNSIVFSISSSRKNFMLLLIIDQRGDGDDQRSGCCNRW